MNLPGYLSTVWLLKDLKENALNPNLPFSECFSCFSLSVLWFGVKKTPYGVCCWCKYYQHEYWCKYYTWTTELLTFQYTTFVFNGLSFSIVFIPNGRPFQSNAKVSVVWQFDSMFGCTLVLNTWIEMDRAFLIGKWQIITFRYLAQKPELPCTILAIWSIKVSSMTLTFFTTTTLNAHRKLRCCPVVWLAWLIHSHCDRLNCFDTTKSICVNLNFLWMEWQSVFVFDAVLNCCPRAAVEANYKRARLLPGWLRAWGIERPRIPSGRQRYDRGHWPLIAQLLRGHVGTGVHLLPTPCPTHFLSAGPLRGVAH